MHQRRLLWQLYPSYLLITLVSLVCVTWYVSGAVREFYYDRAAADLAVRSRLLEERVRELLAGLKSAESRPGYTSGTIKELSRTIGELCRETWKTTGTRITVILPDGTVVGDSLEDPRKMENHADRPEVAAAIAGRTGHSVRWSTTLRERMMYSAAPVTDHNRVIAIVRTAIPVTEIDRTIRSVQGRIALIGLAIAVAAAGVGMHVARRISRPIEEIRRGAERFAAGDLRGRIPMEGSEEISALAESMNVMATELDERIRTILQQRNEREAVLSSMVEGVLAVDTEQRVIGINHAAATLLGLDPETARTRTIPEVIRNPDLQHVVARALASPDPVEAEIVLHDGEERYLHAHGARLRSADDAVVGAVVVVDDVTKVRRLEQLRRDFVANVSHELRTPITAILGFVETLIDTPPFFFPSEGGAKGGQEARRFLDIISSEAQRLNDTINDLLELARIEQEAEQAQIVIEETRIAEVLEAAAQLCEARAETRGIRIEVDAPEDIVARANPSLLERAVENLIDNAIKYSTPPSPPLGKREMEEAPPPLGRGGIEGGVVLVECRKVENEVVISVVDHGPGIEEQHLPRLFERFYRADKGRSRKLGGTGLGLAIVKHIALAHGGRVSVESAVGKGSTFRIHLPAV